MQIVGAIFISLLTLAAFITIWLGFPGSFIMAGLVFVWGVLSGFETFSLDQVVMVLLFMLLVEGIEFLLGSVSAKAYGATSRSLVLGIAGGLAGTFLGASLFAIIGALLGLLAGSYGGVYGGERWSGKDHGTASRAAMATLLGTVAAKLIKSGATVVVGVWMIRVILG